MVAPHTPSVALVGNPNTGKTTLFNALAGMNQRVGNYPGVTVETKKGKLRHQGQIIELIDLPGTYSLAPRSPDEMVAVDVLLGQVAGEPRPDLVVAIVDAANLERNLYLMTQVQELGVPVVVALNMIDVAQAQGLQIDAEQLARNLGVPVVPLQANKGRGLERLKDAIVKSGQWAAGSGPPEALAAGHSPLPTAKGPIFPELFEREVCHLSQVMSEREPIFLVRRALLDVGGYTEKLLTQKHGERLAAEIQEARKRLGQAGCGVPAVEARTRYGWIRTAVSPCLRRPAQRPVTWTDRLDRVLTHRIWGTLIFVALMFLMFQAIFAGARPLMNAIAATMDYSGTMLNNVLAPGAFRSLLADGVLKGVGSVIAFVPQILILFAWIAVLEDCGYMARAAFLMDRLMARAGLNGKSFIPLLSSMGCAVPGIMAARVIESHRDRLATILVAPLMSCSARLPVYLLLISALLSPPSDATWHDLAWWLPGLTLFGLYLLGFVLAPLTALVLKRTLLRGATPVFVLEMPLYKRPSIGTVCRRACDAGVMFLRRAATLILASMIMIWALLYFPLTNAQGQRYDLLAAELAERIERAKDQGDEAEELQRELRTLQQQWKAQSYLGRAGQWLEPVFAPLGWDWRIGMAALASFPAREVMVGTLGILFNQGEGQAGDEQYRTLLAGQLREATWDDQPGRKVFTLPVALSVMVFFALCCQCVSTLAVIRRESNTWRWPAFTFVYMTVLAYVAAFGTYQLSSWLAA
jgi:ferrous iron transport protein B